VFWIICIEIEQSAQTITRSETGEMLYWVYILVELIAESFCGVSNGLINPTLLQQDSHYLCS
jgi:hypothetical protein